MKHSPQLMGSLQSGAEISILLRVAAAISTVGEADRERMVVFGNAIDQAGDVVSIIQEMMPVLEDA